MRRFQKVAPKQPINEEIRHKELRVVILAAGKGIRMYSSIPKVLHEVGSQSLLNQLL